MAQSQPIDSSIYQIFSYEKLTELEARPLKSTGDLDFGPDRVVSIASRDTRVKEQWNGTCTTFAVVAAIENKLGGSIDLAERSLWNEYGTFSTKEAINTAQVHFIYEEMYWPQHQQRLEPRFKGKGRYKLVGVKELESNYLEVLAALDKGNPCVVAMTTPIDLINGKPQIEADSDRKRKSGHAMCVSGYKVENGKAYFLVKNSWGLDCGDAGYQYVAFDFFNKKNRYAIFWEILEVFDRGEQQLDLYMEELALLYKTWPAALVKEGLDNDE